MFANRGKMTKAQMQANMKAMLQKTKVGDSVTTSNSTQGGSGMYKKKQNFVPQKKAPEKPAAPLKKAGVPS